ncbi:MAG: translation initiation factor IF-2 [Chlamydiales bacterium]
MANDKIRIHDLAKGYGLSGKDLASKLRDLGFSQAKSHMSTLDSFEVLQVQGVLEAHGLVLKTEEPPKDEAKVTDVGGGLILRKKRKKKPVPATAPATEAAPAPEQPVPDPVPVAEAGEPARSAAAIEVVESPAPVAADPAPEMPAPAETVDETSTEDPQPAAVVEPVATPPVVDMPAPVEEAPEVAPAPAPVADATAPVADATAPVADATAPVADATGADPTPDAAAQPQPATAMGAATESAPTAEGSAPAAEAATPVAPVAPKEEEDAAAVKRKGNVVGFIDPSSFQSAPARRRPESRRLMSRDDATPDVRPTFTHDRSKALQRGAGAARGTLTAAQLREREQSRFLRRARPGGGAGGRRGYGRQGRQTVVDSPLSGTKVAVEAPVTMQKLAEAFKLKANVVLKVALTSGIGALNINALLDDDSAALLAEEFGIELDVRHQVTAEQAHLDEMQQNRGAIDDELLKERPPSVAFLGHVDHGKTTLIDAIRETQVADNEAGGITQHIGAYQVTTKQGHKVSIIDTPGHAAFTSMRARGARAVDIVVLVVAGDDGVKPHTEEALAHARAAKTPIIVAITKKDKPEFDASRTMQQLTGLGLNPEEWGGETAMLEVSGLKGDGIDELLERVFLEGELLELRAHPTGPAAGVVLEAEKQQGKGIVVHLLVQDGTLKRGDVILAGEGYGKVKSISDDRGNLVQEAGPSTPVEITGLDALPGVGDAFHVVASISKAKEVAVERERTNRAMALAQMRQPSAALEALLGAGPAAQADQINLVVRADVQGSVQVLKHQIEELKHDEIEFKLVHIGVGAVTESDVDLAIASDAKVIAFHVGVNGKARTEAERGKVDILRYEVIYELLDDLRNLMEGALAPEFVEEVQGHVEIRRLFKSSRIGLIAGCYVIDGKIARDNKVRLLRDSQVVYTGALGSLKREKDDAKEVREGFECGIVLRDYRDIREGDIVEAYSMKEVKRTLEGSRKSKSKAKAVKA